MSIDEQKQQMDNNNTTSKTQEEKDAQNKMIQNEKVEEIKKKAQQAQDNQHRANSSPKQDAVKSDLSVEELYDRIKQRVMDSEKGIIDLSVPTKDGSVANVRMVAVDNKNVQALKDMDVRVYINGALTSKEAFLDFIKENKEAFIKECERKGINLYEKEEKQSMRIAEAKPHGLVRPSAELNGKGFASFNGFPDLPNDDVSKNDDVKDKEEVTPTAPAASHNDDTQKRAYENDISGAFKQEEKPVADDTKTSPDQGKMKATGMPSIDAIAEMYYEEKQKGDSGKERKLPDWAKTDERVSHNELDFNAKTENAQAMSEAIGLVAELKKCEIRDVKFKMLDEKGDPTDIQLTSRGGRMDILVGGNVVSERDLRRCFADNLSAAKSAVRDIVNNSPKREDRSRTLLHQGQGRGE